MIYETPCPYCKGVHYSYQNANRCKWRHQIEEIPVQVVKVKADDWKRPDRIVPGETPAQAREREGREWKILRDSGDARAIRAYVARC